MTSGEGADGERKTPPAETAALRRAISKSAEEVEQALGEFLPRPAGHQSRVQDAMRYAVLAGGKRLRPFLTRRTAALFGASAAGGMRTAAAIEALHTYSLVHDDLPCMDDDDLRRGQPTTHKKFDEATAVLAGDALLTFAFEILADPLTHESGEVRSRLVARLAQASGTLGMIGGQMIDILAAERRFNADDVIELQRLKTGALFEFACEAGAILGEAGNDHQRRMRDYARDLGLAFQVADDLIDALGTADEAGKQVGKDQEKGKATLIAALGLEGARAEAEKLACRAADTLGNYDGEEARELRLLPFLLLNRSS